MVENDIALDEKNCKNNFQFSTQYNISLLPCLILFLCPWIFDYKPHESTQTDKIIQSIILLASLCGFIEFRGLTRHIMLSRELKNIVTLFSIWLIGSIASGILHGLELGDIFKASIPPLMFLLGSIFMFKYLKIVRNYDSFCSNMVLIMLAFSAWRFFVNYESIDNELVSTRYQLLSSCIDIFTAYVVAILYFRVTRLDVVAIVVNFGVIFFSLTRTVVVMAGVALAMPYVTQWRLLFDRKALTGVAVVVGALIVGIPIFENSADSALQAWMVRIQPEAVDVIGIDPTAATRLAEIDFQIDSLMESATNMIIGLGIAAENSLTGDWAALVSLAVGPAVIDFHDRGFGHCQYTSYLFTGGVLFGAFALIGTYYSFLVVFRVVRAFISSSQRDTASFIGFWGGLGVTATSVYGLFAGIFGDRGHALFYGLEIGMLFWGYDWAKQELLAKAGAEPVALQQPEEPNAI